MLFDIDGKNNDRGSPAPNVHDVVDPSSVLAKGTNSVNYVTNSTNQSTILAGKNGQFTIIQTGSFTTTQTYNSTNPGAGTFGNDFFNIYTQAHGLGFLPGMFAYEVSGNGQYSPMPYTKFLSGPGTSAVWYTFSIFVDTVNVYIQLTDMVYGNTNVVYNPGFSFKYYLTQQTSN